VFRSIELSHRGVSLKSEMSIAKGVLLINTYY
jgi:hypothetical protein